MPQVSLSTSTSFDGDLNALVEDQGTSLTVRFDLDEPDRKSTRLNSSHSQQSRMPSSA